MFNCSRFACRKEFRVTDPNAVHARIEVSTYTGIIPATRIYCCKDCFDKTMLELDTNNLFTAIVITEMKQVSEHPIIYEIKCKQKFQLKVT